MDCPRIRLGRREGALPLCRNLERGYLPSSQSTRAALPPPLCQKSHVWSLVSRTTPLEDTKAEKKSTVLFTGVNTDQCVLGTFVDEYNAGWNCVLADDACGATTEGDKEITFYNVAVSLLFLFLDSGVMLMSAEFVWIHH